MSSLLLVAALLVPAAPAEGQEGVDPRRFPALVRLLLLPDERAILDGLREDADRREFQAIFWARRDPTPGTPENELETNARAVWKRADDLFSYPREKGAETGCGQMLLLLGRPEEVRGPDEVRGVDTGARFDNLAHVREGTRRPETWVYRDRPGRPFRFTRAELVVGFDSECRFGEGGILAADLRRAAEVLVTRPELGYGRGPDGRLVRTAAARADFPLGLETKLVARAAKGVFVAGLVRVPPQAVPPTRVVLTYRAGDAGTVAASGARESQLAPTADGSTVASWDLALPPGRYQLTVAAQLPESGQGASATLDLEVPDLTGSAALVASPLLLYPDAAGAPSAPAADPRDPYASFRIGARRVQPRFQNAFAPQDALVVVGTLFGAKVDPATARAALRCRFSILKDGRPVARGAEDTFATRDAVASVGPIPLSTYAPGTYTVRLDATDGVAGLTVQQEATFEVRAAGSTP
jgi:GWxTD domain-containing protein